MRFWQSTGQSTQQREFRSLEFVIWMEGAGRLPTCSPRRGAAGASALAPGGLGLRLLRPQALLVVRLVGGLRQLLQLPQVRSALLLRAPPASGGRAARGAPHGRPSRGGRLAEAGREGVVGARQRQGRVAEAVLPLADGDKGVVLADAAGARVADLALPAAWVGGWGWVGGWCLLVGGWVGACWCVCACAVCVGLVTGRGRAAQG